MGMDRGIHILVGDKDYQNLQPLAVAKLFAKVVEQEKIDLVILGKQVWLSSLNDIDNRVKVFKVSVKRNSFALTCPLDTILSQLYFTGNFDGRRFYYPTIWKVLISVIFLYLNLFFIVFCLLLAAHVSDIVFSLSFKEYHERFFKKVIVTFLCSLESPW